MKQEAQLSYYFFHTDEFPLSQLFDCETPSQALQKGKDFCKTELKELASLPGEPVPAGVTVTGTVHIGKNTVIHPGTVIEGTVYIGDNVEIKAGVAIEGPVYIGDGCSISAAANLRPYSILGKKASVGHGSEVKASIIQNGAKVASLSFCGDSVLGKCARVGSGVILANRKFNQSNVGIKILGEYNDLGTDFFGCVLGDSSRIGANCCTLPGTHIGPYSWLLPGTVYKGFLPAQKCVSTEQQHCVKDIEKTELN